MSRYFAIFSLGNPEPLTHQAPANRIPYFLAEMVRLCGLLFMLLFLLNRRIYYLELLNYGVNQSTPKIFRSLKGFF